MQQNIKYKHDGKARGAFESAVRSCRPANYTCTASSEDDNGCKAANGVEVSYAHYYSGYVFRLYGWYTTHAVVAYNNTTKYADYTAWYHWLL